MRNHDFEQGNGRRLVALALALAACGGRATDGRHDGGRDAESGSGGAAALGGVGAARAVAGTSSSSGGSRGGQGGSGGSPSAGGASAPDCKSFDNEEGSLVSVHITNQTADPLYLGPRTRGGCAASLFEVADAANEVLTPAYGCLSCQDVVTGNIHPCLCPASAVITVQPGDTTAQLWRSTYARQTAVPDACAATSVSEECSQFLSVRPGLFTFTARAAKTIECPDIGASTCPPCTADGTGSCHTAGALLAGPDVTTQTTVELDASYGLVAPPDVGGAAGIVKSVELVFTD